MDNVFLSRTPLFCGVALEEIASLLTCLRAVERQYPKGSTIYCAGQRVKSLGLVLQGSVSIESNDLWGNRSILDRVGPGQVFAETYACVPDEALMVSVVAAEDTRVLFLDAGRLLAVCPSACAFHSKIIGNLLSISAQKNLSLSRRIFHTASKSIRARLLSYLSDQALRQGSRDLTIPFDRQALADYLNVDRSALSGELGKMQREGLLKVRKNHFVLPDGPL